MLGGTMGFFCVSFVFISLAQKPDGSPAVARAGVQRVRETKCAWQPGAWGEVENHGEPTNEKPKNEKGTPLSKASYGQLRIYFSLYPT